MQEQSAFAFERKLDVQLILSVIAAGIMSFSGVVVETAMNVTFPTLMSEFSIGTSTVQWMTTAYLLVLAAIVPTSSFLNRRFKTRHIFVVAMCFYISGIVCGFSALSFATLLVGRILEGVGTGLALPLMFNIITEQAPTKHLGVMMGIGTLVTAMAPAVGPSLGGWLAETYGWRMIFASLLPVLVTAFVMGIFSIRQSHETAKVPFDLIGWILLVISFSSLVFATSEAGTQGWLSPVVLGLLIIFVGLLGAFTAWEHRKAGGGDAPLIHMDVFGEKGFVLGVTTIVALQFNVLGLSFLIPNYSQLVMSAGATEAGSILLPGCIVGAIMAPLSGRILDRLGAKRPIIIGSLAMLCAVCVFALLSQSLSTAPAICIYIVFAFGQSLMVGNTMTTALQFLVPKRKADGNAIINTLQQLAGAIGTSVVTTIVNSAQANASDMTAATMIGTREAYILLIVVAGVAVISMLVVFFRIGGSADGAANETFSSQGV